MATALQQQLAKIAANSTHQLDLKAQKARHSASLLFEPRDAATQSFDTIYQICYEGFEELCALDSRFAAFGRDIFSEQSKNEDRTQMTKKENVELDEVLERFLGLVGGRLLLKPAMKTVEWLVRRFRVQESNTEALLLTFLPYHTSHIFPTLLSILPSQLPASFGFLQPYKASLQSPPRNAILSAAVGNQNFFSAFNNYMLKIADVKHHSTILLGFWASLTAQAVNGMIDTSRSGRDSIRKQREEDLLLRVLPVLQSALSVKDIPELYFGACMIISILATKASLEDKALDALMEAVAGSWTEETLAEGIMCLAVVAEEKLQVSVPITVAKAVCQADGAFAQLVPLTKSQRVSKLATGVAVGCVQLAYKKKDSSFVAKVEWLLSADVLPEHHTRLVLEKLLSTVSRLRATDSLSEVANAISDLLTIRTDDPEGLRILEQASQKLNVSLAALQLVPLEAHDSNVMELDEPSTAEMEANPIENGTETGFENLLTLLPQLPEVSSSFLDINSHLDIFERYREIFQMSLSSKSRTEQILALPQLHQDEARWRPEYFTFHMRVWSTSSTIAARVASLNTIRGGLQDVQQTSDVIHLQNLLPYLVVALSDPFAKVRTAGADLCKTMCAFYENQPNGSSSPTDYDVRIAVGNIYGPDLPLKHRLHQNDVSKFLNSILHPALEDAVLDSNYVKQLIVDVLDEKQERSTGLSKNLRTDVCAFFASHLVTPVFGVRLVLLDILNAVGKTAAMARTQLVLPCTREYLNLTGVELLAKLRAERIAVADVDNAVLGSLTHRSETEIQLLRGVAAGEIGRREELVPCAFHRIAELFPLMKGSQIEIAEWLVDLAMGSPEFASAQAKDEALQTLRNLQLPNEVLVYLVETLPKATDLQEQPATKKRRMSHSNSGQLPEVDHVKVQATIRRFTLILELVEASSPGNHPQLLRGLFHALGELHHFKTMLGSELVYTFQILLGCILAVVDGLRKTPDADVDRTVIRTDLIVECVRTTSSTQIHNTALLLVSSLASWAPELVLHCVMPLFTFMSSTLLRKSDSFSAHITDQTVERIVPPLAASLKKKGKSLVVGASELLLSFTAAFEHIPLHRRAALFKHLVETLGAEETLFAVVAMLIERYGNDSSVSMFVADLTNQFSGLTAIKAAKQYLDLVSDTLKPKRNLSDVLLSFGDKDVTEKVESQRTLLTGLAALLRSTTLRERVASYLAGEGSDSRAMQTTYAAILEHTMMFNQDIGASSPLKNSASALLLSVLGFMPTKDFIQSSAQLMQTGTDQTRQQVFRALEARVNEAKTSDSATRQIFLNVLPNCGVFLREDQPVATRHAAVSCIDQIAEKYGKTDRLAVLAVAQQVAGNFALGSDDVSLRIISILCLASMVEILGDDCIPILPSVLNQVLTYLEDDIKRATDGEPDLELQAAGFALLNSILDHLPWMLADKYLDQSLLLADQAAAFQPPIDALQEYGNLIAKEVQPTQLFVAIRQTFSQILTQDDEGFQYHLGVFHTAIKHLSKATITKNARVIFDILLEALGLRRTLAPHRDDMQQSNDLFELVDKIALDVTLKLNDATFRPFFVSFVEWATKASRGDGAGNGRTPRQISLYSFSLTLFDQLQSIVTTYAGFLLENASEQLQKSSVSTSQDQELLNLVLQALSSSFNHDQDEFWQTPAHFEAVAIPLINQIQRLKVSRLIDQAIATVTDLAAAARSQEHLKAMSTAIIAHLRSKDASVRLAAVKCQRSLTERLTVDWLDLLPEMLPIISELHEDDDEEVEQATLRWAREIEEITGESLDPMLA